MKRSSNAPLLLGLAMLVIILIINAGLTYRDIWQINDDGRGVAHVRDVLVRVDEILIALGDAETGERGFIISGNEEFLQPYQDAVNRMPILLALLNDEVAASPEISGQIKILNQMAQSRLDVLSQSIDLRRKDATATTSDAAALIANGQDKAAMDAIRHHIDGIKEVESKLLVERRQQRTSSYDEALITSVITALLALLAVAALAWVVIRNLAVRQKAATLLHEQQELLRTTLVSIGDGVITTDTQGKVTFLNAVAQSLTGWSQYDAGGKRLDQVFNIVHEQTRLPAESPVAKVLASGIVVGLANHTMLIARNGSERPIDDSAAPIRDEEGAVRGVVLVFRDVTERKQLEDAEREAALRLRLVLDSVPQKIFTAKPNGEIDYFNPFWTQFTGLPLEQLLGWGWTQAIHPDDRQENLNAWKRSIDSGRPFEASQRFLGTDGEYRWHVSRAVAITDEAGLVQTWVGANTDIHAEKSLANELREVAADLSEADRRKNEFLAILAHELRNPLAPIRNSAQVLRANGEAIQRASALMERQIGQMVRLVDDLLDVSRISRGKIELRKSRIELGSALQDALDTARPQFTAVGLTLGVRPTTEPIYLDADPARLAQIIGNLLSNACKFTDRGGQVLVSIEREDKQAILRVEDNGIGIASDKLPGIFEMFTQIDTALERSEGGLGIGLALVKNLAELHGGTVEVASAGIGMGSVFTVRLPIASAVSAATIKPPLEIPQPVSGRRILIVDDNLDSAESLDMLLKMTGNETFTAYDGLEAVQKAAEVRPDIVLLDIGLPKLNGYQVAEEIRKAAWGKDIVLIALTGWGQDGDRLRSAAAGFNAHMVKPIAYDDLINLLDGFPIAHATAGPLAVAQS